MSTDYYKILEVDRTATPEQIKQAYRKKASQHHPDKGGDTSKFQQVQAAYDILSDPEKRAAYDNPRPQHQHFNFHDIDGAQFNDILSKMFGGGFQHFGQQPRRGQVRVSLWITLQDVATGGTRTVSLGTASGASTVEIEIPLGINDGDNVHYSGIGPGGSDLIVNYRIKPDSKWQRQGLNLIQEQRVNVWDLILGGSIQVTDVTGNQLQITVPAGTQPGTLLRAKNRGFRNSAGNTGDMFVRIHAVLPTTIAPEIKQAIRNYR